MKQPQITLALTHFNRFPLLEECVAQVEDDPRIGEICIVDDASTDGSYEKLLAWSVFRPKVSLYRNRTNLDCYENKKQAAWSSKHEWVILFDSDNILAPAYLDRIFALPEWDESTVYCPEFAEPHFDYTEFAGSRINHTNVASFMGRLHFATALNTCNFFVNRNEYLIAWREGYIPHTADSIFMMLNWFKLDNSMEVVPGLRYFHRVHDQSHYKLNVHKTGDFHKKVESDLRKMK